MIVAFVSVVILFSAVILWQRAWAAFDQFSREAQSRREARFLLDNLPRSAEEIK